MIHGLHDLRGGFDVEADVVIIGSGAGGAVAALNLAEAGMRVVVLEAGPQVRTEDMTRDGPAFLAKYYWEGGQRILLGSGTWPAMSGRCLGGSTVVNSAILFALPDWVREAWIAEEGLESLRSPELDAAFTRVLTRLKVAPTPREAWGRRNALTYDVLKEAGLDAKPLPRAVQGCKGSGDCLTGCGSGAKQSVDKSYLPDAVAAGAQIYTCAVVDRVITAGTRAVGVEGWIVDPDGHAKLAPFRVHAPRVMVAAGALHTPVILQRSGITVGGRVGGTLFAHLSGFAVGVMDEVVDPWVGATQGVGAFSDRVKGLKFESLWAPTALIGVEWGGLGNELYEMLPDLKRALMVALVYRSRMTGRVRARRNGLPDARLWVPNDEMHVVLREVKRVVDAMLARKAEYVFTGVHGVPDRIRTAKDAEALLSTSLRPRDVTMTVNHMFGSCRMSSREDRGVVDQQGKVYGVDGLWICDASIFPSPSAVNPQGTVMALSDVISRRVGEG